MVGACIAGQEATGFRVVVLPVAQVEQPIGGVHDAAEIAPVETSLPFDRQQVASGGVGGGQGHLPAGIHHVAWGVRAVGERVGLGCGQSRYAIEAKRKSTNSSENLLLDIDKALLNANLSFLLPDCYPFHHNKYHRFPHSIRLPHCCPLVLAV